MRRSVALWALLFAVYAATLAVPAVPGHQFAGSELHHLLAAESVVSDGELDLDDEYRDESWRAFSDRPVAPDGRRSGPRVLEPYPVGFTLLIAPAYAIGGGTGAELLVAALAALAFTLAAALARRVVPEPWATGAALVCGLSPPALAFATSVSPQLAGGALLAGAALLALRARDEPRLPRVAACALLLAAVPWVSGALILPAAALALVTARWLLVRRRGFFAFVGFEVILVSVVVYVTLNEALFGGFTPGAVALPGAPTGEVLRFEADRLPRLAGLLVDRVAGLLRWAPVFALAGWGAWLLVRSRRDRIGRVIPERYDAEAACLLTGLVCVGVAVVAAVAIPGFRGPWLGPRWLVPALPAVVALCAWGLWRARRVGAVLAAVTLGTSVWVAVVAGAWADTGTEAPLGPALELLPRL